MLKLHHAPHTRAGRIVWLLEELQSPCELHRMEIHPGALKSDPHRVRHPLGRVPVLQDGEVMPPVNTIVAQTLLLPPERRCEEILGQARRLLTKTLEPINETLAGREFMIGDRSGVDFMLGHACFMARRLGCMPQGDDASAGLREAPGGAARVRQGHQDLPMNYRGHP